LHPKNKKYFSDLGKAQNKNLSLLFTYFYFAERSDEGLICFADSSGKEINIRLLAMPYPRKSVSNTFSFFPCPQRPQRKI